MGQAGVLFDVARPLLELLSRRSEEVTATGKLAIDLNRSKRRRRAAGIASLGILVALVAAAAFGLSQWRSSERKDAKQAFEERSRTIAAQVESLVLDPRPNLVAGVAQVADRGNLRPRDLIQVAGPFGEAWALDEDGAVVARSPGSTGRPTSAVAAAAKEPRVSRVLGRRGEVELGIPIEASGRVSVVVARYPVSFISSYLGAGLEPIPTSSDAGMFVVDDRGRILAGHGHAVGRGSEILSSIDDREFGEFEIGDETLMVSQSEIPGAPWTVVLAAPRSEVLAAAGGPAGWVPWTALAAFAVLAATAILLLLRVGRDAERLASFSADLEQREREAQEAARAKNDFISGMAHELRTPLAAIRMFTDLMKKDENDPLSPSQASTVDEISTSVTHLMDLLNDTMDIARVESGQLPLRPERVSAVALAIGVVDGVQPIAVQRGIELTLDADGRIGEVFIDPARLRQVLINFLSNALKFTPAGGTIAVRVSRHGPSSFVVAVEDTGIGMSEEDTDRVFTAGAPSARPVRDEDTTRGLGLALTRRIVEAMGGHVGVESELGVGSTFYAVLPKVNAERFAGIDPASASRVDSVLRAPPPPGAADRRVSSRGPRGADSAR